MPCDLMQPSLPLAGLAAVYGLVLAARWLGGRRTAVLNLAGGLALLAIAGVLLSTTHHLGCPGAHPVDVRRYIGAHP